MGDNKPTKSAPSKSSFDLSVMIKGGETSKLPKDSVAMLKEIVQRMKPAQEAKPQDSQGQPAQSSPGGQSAVGQTFHGADISGLAQQLQQMALQKGDTELKQVKLEAAGADLEKKQLEVNMQKAMVAQQQGYVPQPETSSAFGGASAKLDSLIDTLSNDIIAKQAAMEQSPINQEYAELQKQYRSKLNQAMEEKTLGRSPYGKIGKLLGGLGNVLSLPFGGTAGTDIFGGKPSSEEQLGILDHALNTLDPDKSFDMKNKAAEQKLAMEHKAKLEEIVAQAGLTGATMIERMTKEAEQQQAHDKATAELEKQKFASAVRRFGLQEEIKDERELRDLSSLSVLLNRTASQTSHLMKEGGPMADAFNAWRKLQMSDGEEGGEETAKLQASIDVSVQRAIESGESPERIEAEINKINEAIASTYLPKDTEEFDARTGKRVSLINNHMQLLAQFAKEAGAKAGEFSKQRQAAAASESKKDQMPAKGGMTPRQAEQFQQGMNQLIEERSKKR